MGSTTNQYLSIGPTTRATVNAADVTGLASAEFSTGVESDQLLMVDRTMTWEATVYGSYAETVDYPSSISRDVRQNSVRLGAG